MNIFFHIDNMVEDNGLGKNSVINFYLITDEGGKEYKYVCFPVVDGMTGWMIYGCG